MKIAELEDHHDACEDLEQKICEMVDNHEFPGVFSVCIESFPSIVPAINFRKKREIFPEIPEFAAITTICKYAPLLFEHAVIETLFEFIKSARVLSQSEKDFLGSIEAARQREQLAHSLWNYIEKHPGMFQRDIRTELGVVQEEAVAVVELWQKLGILDRQPEDRSYRLNFRTRLDAEVSGVCPACGVRGKGRKELFFRSVSCQKCGAQSHYYIDYARPQ